MVPIQCCGLSGSKGSSWWWRTVGDSSVRSAWLWLILLVLVRCGRRGNSAIFDRPDLWARAVSSSEWGHWALSLWKWWAIHSVRRWWQGIWWRWHAAACIVRVCHTLRATRRTSSLQLSLLWRRWWWPLWLTCIWSWQSMVIT